MPNIARDKIDEIRQRTNIVEVVRRYVEIKRAGTGSWSGLCPFHSEKTPSFRVNEQGFYKCFGCDARGDVFTFLQNVEQKTFMEVVRDLAQGAAVDLPEQQLSSAERRALQDAESERARLFRISEMATAFYEEILRSPEGKPGLDYLHKRGLSDATIAAFRIGYAPGDGGALREYLAGKQMPVGDAERLGLVRQNERGRYDFFRDRVMLPVFDRQKRAVGFSARLLDPEAKAAKYVNSQESPLFQKKNLLYGLHAAQETIRRGERAVLVEGNFDVITLHEAGFKETVAPMGTALTVDQIEQVGRFARHVVVLFDGDAAGERAARRVVPLFLDADVDGRVARLPTGVDPDDFVRKEGVAAMTALLEGARPMVEQFIDDLVGAADASIPGRVAALEEGAALLVKVRNPTARELYGARMGAALGLQPAQVSRALRVAMSAAAGRPAGDQATPVVGAPGGPVPVPAELRVAPPPRVEIEVCALLVGNPRVATMEEAGRVADLMIDSTARRLFRTAFEALRTGGHLDVPAWLEGADLAVRDPVWTLVMDGRMNQLEGAERALRNYLAKLEGMRIDAELAMVDREIRDAAARHDDQAVRVLNPRHIDLLRRKQELKSS